MGKPVSLARLWAGQRPFADSDYPEQTGPSNGCSQVVNNQLCRFLHGYRLGDTKQDYATVCWQTFPEGQLSEVRIKCYEQAIFARGASQYVGVIHTPVIFIHPNNVMPGIA